MTALQEFLATPNGRLVATAAMAVGILLGAPEAHAGPEAGQAPYIDEARGLVDPAADRFVELDAEYSSLVELRDTLLSEEKSCGEAIVALEEAAGMMREIAADESVPARRRLANMAGLAESTVAELLSEEPVPVEPPDEPTPARPSGSGSDPFAAPRFREASAEAGLGFAGVVRSEAEIREATPYARLNEGATRLVDGMTQEVGVAAERSRECLERAGRVVDSFVTVVEAAGSNDFPQGVSRDFLDSLNGDVSSELSR